MSELTPAAKSSMVQYPEVPTQTVLGFNSTDAHTRSAYCAFVIARHFHQIGQDEFTPKDALDLVTEITHTDLSEIFPGPKYSNSPLHKGLHAISKGETKEVDEIKDEANNIVEVVDLFARGARGLVKKDIKVGLKLGGKYYTNASQYPDFYTPVSDGELEGACGELISIAQRQLTSGE